MTGLNTLRQESQFLFVFLDLQKAFDSVPHRDLLLVVKISGLHPILLKCICSYLTHRSQRVVVDGVASSEVHAISGVPQGSVLGPLLSKMYINGITDLKLTTGCKLVLYADDIIVYKPIEKHEDYIDNLQAWSNSSRIMFNTQKCKYMAITRKRSNSL